MHVPVLTASRYAFVVECPLGHSAVQQFTEAQIRAGAVRFGCYRCGCHWTSTRAIETAVLQDIHEQKLHPALAIG